MDIGGGGTVRDTAVKHMEAGMRNRKKQQELIKAKVVKVSKEEKLDLYDYCGIKDPTPYEAVKAMIRRGESVSDGLHLAGGVPV